MAVTLHEAELDGKKIGYSSETIFLVQVSRSKNRKSGYNTRWMFTGNLHQAVSYYRSVNIGLGYKKRLLMVGAKNPVLARATS